MAENNNDDALSEYLEAWVRKTSGMEWHDQQVASLKEELAAASSLAQQATVKYLLLRGRFNLRGLMDHTMENMGISTGVWWKPSTPVACWGEYIAKRPALQECLEERNVNVEEAGALLSAIYHTLSEDGSQDDQQTTGSTLRIGHPLDHDQRKVMACLCEDANVPYEVVPDPVTDALA